MYVYVWKDAAGTPFYVGFTKNKRRSNPRNEGGRNWLCRQKLEEVGVGRVIVELRPVFTTEEGVALEKALIAEYGRIQTGDGPLTNLTLGGDGAHSPSPAHVEALRNAMRDPNHPIRSPEARAKQAKRMRDPDLQAKMRGEANPAKRPEVRTKLKKLWESPEHREKIIKARTGIKQNLSEEKRQARRDQVANNPAMLGWGERNGKDSEFDAKRVEGIRAAQPKRVEKMRDPVALAQRKERLRATMNSPEYKAKRAQWDTPEYREKLAAAKREYWEKKRTSM